MFRNIAGIILAACSGLAAAELNGDSSPQQWAMTDSNFNWIPDASEPLIKALGERPEIDTALLNYASSIGIAYKNIRDGYTESDDTAKIITKARHCLNPVIGESYATRHSVAELMSSSFPESKTLDKAIFNSEVIDITYGSSSIYCTEFLEYRDRLRIAEYPDQFQPEPVETPSKSWWKAWNK